MNNSVPMDHMDLLLYAAMDMADSDDLISELWEAPDESVCLSRKADRRIWKTLCRIRENREKQQPFHPVRETLKRVAMIVLITATVGFTCLMSIDAIREAVWKFFTQWNEKSITVEIKPLGNRMSRVSLYNSLNLVKTTSLFTNRYNVASL